ncbi:Hypothetical protein CAP_4298 [Chondromyces apiculatus DSM 436]|uniref:Uncharacterized protein n=2 Tax=Chondromyces apiculatus TaxID=51 RepID=A0A017T6K0_9BACT|nr:Hypothetical protein CAP_4298 [Chondromyces apiculatus DSM 436]
MWLVYAEPLVYSVARLNVEDPSESLTAAGEAGAGECPKVEAAVQETPGTPVGEQVADAGTREGGTTSTRPPAPEPGDTEVTREGGVQG